MQSNDQKNKHTHTRPKNTHPTQENEKNYNLKKKQE